MNSGHARDNKPVGIFNYAHSYASMAGAFRTSSNSLDCTHPEAPIYFLYYHALELYLKSFLVSQGVSEGELRSRELGHNLDALLKKSEVLGLKVSPQVSNITKLAGQTDNVMSSRYLRTGHHRHFTLDVLHKACVELHASVCPAAYKAVGGTRRPILV